jgi:hypothetical protein
MHSMTSGMVYSILTYQHEEVIYSLIKICLRSNLRIATHRQRVAHQKGFVMLLH